MAQSWERLLSCILVNSFAPCRSWKVLYAASKTTVESAVARYRESGTAPGLWTTCGKCQFYSYEVRLFIPDGEADVTQVGEDPYGNVE
jgi:hypothetical protein